VRRGPGYCSGTARPPREYGCPAFAAFHALQSASVASRWSSQLAMQAASPPQGGTHWLYALIPSRGQSRAAQAALNRITFRRSTNWKRVVRLPSQPWVATPTRAFSQVRMSSMWAVRVVVPPKETCSAQPVKTSLKMGSAPVTMGVLRSRTGATSASDAGGFGLRAAARLA
jgi:hypothetical protein